MTDSHGRKAFVINLFAPLNFLTAGVYYLGEFSFKPGRYVAFICSSESSLWLWEEGGGVEGGRENSEEGGQGCPLYPETSLTNISSSPLNLALLGAGGASSSLPAAFSEQRHETVTCFVARVLIGPLGVIRSVVSPDAYSLTSLWLSRQRERLERGLHRVIERARIALCGCAGVES